MSVEGPPPLLLVLPPSGPDAPPCPGVRCFLSLLFLLCRTLCLHPQETEMNSWDFPGGSVVKTLHSQCKEPGFHLWLGN